jgi:hypothetical protein
MVISARWRSLNMQEIEAKRLLHDIPTSTDTTGDQLEIGERIARITIMTAFIAVLAVEAWLLWQVCQLF